MQRSFELIGGMLINKGIPSKDGLTYPTYMIPIFKSNDRFFVQVSKRARHPYTYYEDCTFEKVNISDEKIIPLNNKELKLDIQRKIYLLALSENSVIYGNLEEFAEKIINLRHNSQVVLESKVLYSQKLNQFKKYGFTSQNKEITEYIESNSHSF